MVYQKQLSWINDYNNDNDFNRLGMPLDELNIGVKDLDRKLKVLKAMHNKNLALHPDYLLDIPFRFFSKDFYAHGHPNDQGYEFLADYIFEKLNLTHTGQ